MMLWIPEILGNPRRTLGWMRRECGSLLGYPQGRNFLMPLDEDEVFPAGAKPSFRSTWSYPTMETSAQAAPQTYAENAISRCAGGAGAAHRIGLEPQAGETPNQALKPRTKSNIIILSSWQRGNPVLKFVRLVPWEFGDVVLDYVLDQSTLVKHLCPLPQPLLPQPPPITSTSSFRALGRASPCVACSSR